MIRASVIAVILVVAGAVARAAEPATPVERAWRIDGVERKAIVYAPADATTAKCPLLFSFHGHGGSARAATARFRFQALWPEAIVVYMQGLPTAGMLTDPQGLKAGWQSAEGAESDRDLKFFDAVLASMKRDYKVDQKRIFATGHSNGGGFTYVLWAARGSVFAAVAPCAAIPGRSALKMKPKPALHVAGKEDPLVRFGWQERAMAAERKINGCDEAGKPWESAGPCVGTIYPSKSGTPLITVIHPGGHALPDAAFTLIVRFFKAQQH
ncbi:MAG TPA: hypothetical protein VKT77_21975 [Chthonomonadaceae bacterium]|nr:hypothetical protein [Chthonomonadaceae bacterium]